MHTAQSSPTLLSVAGLAREYLLQKEEGQRDMMLKQKTRKEFSFFFSVEIKYNHSLSFLNSVYFKALLLQIYFISINVPYSVDLKTEMMRHSFLFYFSSKPV